ncbi:hypothetical protein [Streptodolium elevatio]|uniref:Fibronectin type-III domain-containing protein n=1 Tax=Streptodolium elevatio TaxID=3157996 RepID=A0ABV3DD09_9ACTN
MTPWDEPEGHVRVDVSLEKRGPAGRRSAGRLVPPPDPGLDPALDPALDPGQDRGPESAPELGSALVAAVGAEAESPHQVGPAAEPDPSVEAQLPVEPRQPGEPPPPGDAAAPPDLDAVPAEVSLRIPLWWSDGGRSTAAPSNPPYWAGTPRSDGPERPDHLDPGDDGRGGGPAPAEAERSFAWAFDGAEDPPVYSSSGRRFLWILGGVAAVAAVVAAALVLGSDGEKTAKRPNGPPQSAAQPPPAGAPPGPASAYMPRTLALSGFENKVQVTWQPPERAGEAVGFMVVAQSREGAVLEHRLVSAGETSAVFAAPPMTRDGCVVVATLVRGPTGVTPIRADPVCR